MKKVTLTESELVQIIERMVQEQKVTKAEMVTKYRNPIQELINSFNQIVSDKNFCGNLETGIQNANKNIDKLIQSVQSNEKVNSPDEALGLLVNQIDKTQSGLIGNIIKNAIGKQNFTMSQEMRDGILSHLNSRYGTNGKRAVQVINNFITQSNVPVKKVCQTQNKENTNTNTDELTTYVAKMGIKPQHAKMISTSINNWLKTLPQEYRM